MKTVCAQCNAPMSCCPEGNCWCADYPKMEPDPEAKGCLCPECLREKLQQSQNSAPTKARSAS